MPRNLLDLLQHAQRYVAGSSPTHMRVGGNTDRLKLLEKIEHELRLQSEEQQVAQDPLRDGETREG